MSALNVVKLYATNGREAVNIVQLAAGVAQTDKQMEINAATVEWVVTSGQYVPRPDRKVPLEAEAGLVNGLAVYGPNMGMLLELEVTANSVAPGTGELLVTGIIEEEEQRSNFKKTRRKSMARSSVENVLTVIRRQLGIFPHDYDIHVNFPGGVPIDGPSAGIAMATAVVSAIRKEKVDNYLAMTGELSIRGGVKPVGGVPAKLEAAHQAGCRRVFIPKENWQERFKNFAEGMEVIPVETLNEVLAGALLADPHKEKVVNPTPLDEILARLEINPKTNPSSVNLPDQGQSC